MPDAFKFWCKELKLKVTNDQFKEVKAYFESEVKTEVIKEGKEIIVKLNAKDYNEPAFQISGKRIKGGYEFNKVKGTSGIFEEDDNEIKAESTNYFVSLDLLIGIIKRYKGALKGISSYISLDEPHGLEVMNGIEDHDVPLHEIASEEELQQMGYIQKPKGKGLLIRILNKIKQIKT